MKIISVIVKKYILLLLATLLFSIVISTYVFKKYDFFQSKYRINSEIPQSLLNNSLISHYMKDSVFTEDLISNFFNENNFKNWKNQSIANKNFDKNYLDQINLEYLKEIVFFPSNDILVSNGDINIALIIKSYAEHSASELAIFLLNKLEKITLKSDYRAKNLIKNITLNYDTKTSEIILSGLGERLYSLNFHLAEIYAAFTLYDNRIILYREPVSFSELQKGISPLALYLVIAIFLQIITFFFLAIYEGLKKDKLK